MQTETDHAYRLRIFEHTPQTTNYWTELCSQSGGALDAIGSQYGVTRLRTETLVTAEERQHHILANNQALVESGSAARAAMVVTFLHLQADEYAFVAAEFTSMQDDGNARERLASARALREAADAIERGEDLT